MAIRATVVGAKRSCSVNVGTLRARRGAGASFVAGTLLVSCRSNCCSGYQQARAKKRKGADELCPLTQAIRQKLRGEGGDSREEPGKECRVNADDHKVCTAFNPAHIRKADRR